jgi:hypothetical protein
MATYILFFHVPKRCPGSEWRSTSFNHSCETGLGGFFEHISVWPIMIVFGAFKETKKEAFLSIPRLLLIYGLPNLSNRDPPCRRQMNQLVSSTVANMQLSDSGPHFPSAIISGDVAGQAIQSNSTDNLETYSGVRVEERFQQPLSFSPRPFRPPPIQTGNAGLQRSQSTLTTRRDRTSAPSKLHEGASPSVRITRKRALDSAGLDEIDHLQQRHGEQSPDASDSWAFTSNSHICLCQPNPKIPRPRNGEWNDSTP